MKKGLLIIVLLMSIVLDTAAQRSSTKSRAEQSINLSYIPQWYLNKIGSIEHSGVDRQQQVLYPKNTFGQAFALEYQRITRYGLAYSIGAQYSSQKHDVGVHYNLGYVDEELPRMKITTIDAHYAATINNVALKVMAGYCWRSPFGMTKGWSVLAKGGITVKCFTSNFQDYTHWMVGYPKNDTFFIKRVGVDGVYLGNIVSLNFSGELYVGISRDINFSFLRSLSVGIEGTHRLRYSSGHIEETLDKVDSYTGELINQGKYVYEAKDFALGIRFTVGLWP